MQVINDFEQGSDEWKEFRRGKISGTRLGEVYSPRGGRKIGFYEVIAERLSLEPDGEDRMERGLRLEQEAIDLFCDVMEKKVERPAVCVSDINPNIIQSPDGLIKKGKKYTEAVEVKCISPARHIQAVVENEVPKEFESQMIQYFIVNEHLEKLYFVFYDPRIVAVPLHIIEVTREELGDRIGKFQAFQLEQLREMDEIVERLSF